MASSNAITRKLVIPARFTHSIHVASMPYVPSSEIRALFDTFGDKVSERKKSKYKNKNYG